MGLPSSNSIQALNATDASSAIANPFASGEPCQASLVGAPDSALMIPEDAEHEDAAPSRQDLLQRAAELGPVRMTWASIAHHPSDPILGEKMLPRVAERRARFRKFVKVALGACVACCMIATVASAFSSTSSTTGSTPSKTSSSHAKTAPAIGVVPVEKLDLVARTKAPSHVVAAVRPVPAPKFVKRH